MCIGARDVVAGDLVVIALDQNCHGTRIRGTVLILHVVLDQMVLEDLVVVGAELYANSVVEPCGSRISQCVVGRSVVEAEADAPARRGIATVGVAERRVRARDEIFDHVVRTGDLDVVVRVLDHGWRAGAIGADVDGSCRGALRRQAERTCPGAVAPQQQLVAGRQSGAVGAREASPRLGAGARAGGTVVPGGAIDVEVLGAADAVPANASRAAAASDGRSTARASRLRPRRRPRG